MYALGEQSQKEIAVRLGVHQSTVSQWLSRTLKEEKERKRDKAFSLWLACHTQEEIAGVVDVPRNTLSTWEDEFVKKCEDHKLTNWTDFDPPIYNVWKQQMKNVGVLLADCPIGQGWT
jgi:transcriptional regulator with XRE-family HTH domain